jgi:ABC-type dipeptide/oligopeptide/nickel transport system permease subunit
MFMVIALAIGAICGYAVGFYGRAVERRFAVLAAAFRG